MNRREFLKTAIGGLASLAIGCTTDLADKPNIFLYVLDTLRKDRFNSKTMPFLKELSEDFVVFERAYSNSSWTIPSHASLFTGEIPENHGCYDFFNPDNKELRSFKINKKLPTLAEVFKSRGYHTFGFSGNPRLFQNRGFNRGFDAFSIRRARGINGDELNTRIFQQKKDMPFFCFVNYIDAHYPYGGNKEEKRVCFEIFNSDFFKIVKRGEAKIDEINLIRELYDNGVKKLDCLLSDNFYWMKKNNLYDSSLIVITADHGEMLGEEDFIGHGTILHEHLIKVPLLVKFPYSLYTGLNNNLVQLSDIYRFLLSVSIYELSSPYIVSQTEVLDADYETDRNKFNHPLERRIYDNGKDETTVWVQTKHYLQEVCNENIPAQMLKQLGYV